MPPVRRGGNSRTLARGWLFIRLWGSNHSHRSYARGIPCCIPSARERHGNRFLLFQMRCEGWHAIMPTKRLPRPRDPIQLAKLIGDIATGQIKDEVEDRRNSAAVELYRRTETRNHRSPQSRRHKHQLCRAVEFVDQNGPSALHASDQCFQQKIREPRLRPSDLFRALQFLPHPSNAPHYTSAGGRRDGQTLGA